MAHTRREFLNVSLAAAASAYAAPARDDISLAAWSLNGSFRAGKWKNLDLPKILREILNINGLEYVNQYFENPTLTYLRQLKRNCANYGVTSVSIMVDEEDPTASPDKNERIQAAIAHRKWVDIAQFLGCHAIRANMRGGPPDWKQDQDLVSRAAETFRNILDYAKGSGVSLVIENHGGASSDPGILVALMKAVNNPNFGVLVDFGNWNRGEDRYEAIRKTIPYAKGVSVKGWFGPGGNPDFDVEKAIRICQQAGYHGFWGIESSGARFRPGQPAGPPAAKRSTEEIWDSEVKAVLSTRELLERTVLKKG